MSYPCNVNAHQCECCGYIIGVDVDGPPVLLNTTGYVYAVCPECAADTDTMEDFVTKCGKFQIVSGGGREDDETAHYKSVL